MEENFNGVIGIIFKRGNPTKYLLIYNKKTGNITFPSGGREYNETSDKQTLEREIREETGLLPSEYIITKTPIIHQFVYNNRKLERAGKTARQPVFLIETKKEKLCPKDPDSVIDGWHTLKEVEKRLTFPDSRELFKKAIKYI